MISSRKSRRKSYINTTQVLLAFGIVLLVFLSIVAWQRWMISTSAVISMQDVPIKENDKKKKLIEACDALSKNAWDDLAYQKILSDIRAFQSTSLISEEEAINMENMARVSYASSLHVACENWRKTDGIIQPDELNLEVNVNFQYEDCKNILVGDKSAFDAYYAALKAPQIITEFLNQEYKSSTASSTYNYLVSNCQYANIAHFTNMTEIFTQSKHELERFRNFSKRFNQMLDYYRKDPDDDDRRSDMSEFCPENNEEIWMYKYYMNQIKLLGICQ